MRKICVIDWQKLSVTMWYTFFGIFDDTSLWILPKTHDPSLCDTPDDITHSLVAILLSMRDKPQKQLCYLVLGDHTYYWPRKESCVAFSNRSKQKLVEKVPMSFRLSVFWKENVILGASKKKKKKKKKKERKYLKTK